MSLTDDMTNAICGKACLIVGATGGLGRRLSLAMAESGARLFLMARNLDDLEVVRELAASHGAEVHVAATDATDSAAVERSFDRAVELLGRIDILINCQGLAQIEDFTNLTDAAWERVLAVNLSSVFYCSRLAFSRMKAQGGGQIVNIGSQASLVGARKAAGYLAVKAGIEGLGRALWHEGRDLGIRVTTVCPGAMDTRMRWEATPEMPRDALLDPREVAHLIRHLLAMPTLSMAEPVVPVRGPRMPE